MCRRVVVQIVTNLSAESATSMFRVEHCTFLQILVNNLPDYTPQNIVSSLATAVGTSNLFS
jgi:hypothetical protein